MEIQNYVLAWLVYVGSCTALLVIGWGWTRPIPWAALRNSIRLVVATIMLLPMAHPAAPEFKVPAIIVAMLGWLAGDSAAAISALSRVAGMALLALIVAVAVSFTRYGGRDWPAPGRVKPAVSDAPASSRKPGTAGEKSATEPKVSAFSSQSGRRNA